VVFQNGQLREAMEALGQSRAENNRMMGFIHMIASLPDKSRRAELQENSLLDLDLRYRVRSLRFTWQNWFEDTAGGATTFYTGFR